MELVKQNSNESTLGKFTVMAWMEEKWQQRRLVRSSQKKTRDDDDGGEGWSSLTILSVLKYLGFIEYLVMHFRLVKGFSPTDTLREMNYYNLPFYISENRNTNN